MKADAPRRKIFDDAIDMLVGDDNSAAQGSGVVEIPIDRVVPFRDHPFRLYEGERLRDMIESIKEHGVLTPIIVKESDTGYEMLAGHNRTNAARLAGLTTVPAIVKKGITDEEAYVYVIETNLMQRSFSDFLPSEKAAILDARYEKMKCQGKRSDIIREIAALQGGGESALTCGLLDQKLSKEDADGTFGLIGQKLIGGEEGTETFGLIDRKLTAETDGRNQIAVEYGLSSKSVARLLRLNHLIPAFKGMVDDGTLPIYAAVDLSFISKDAQGWIYDAAEEFRLKINIKTAKIFRDESASLTKLRAREIAKELTREDRTAYTYQSVKLPKVTYKKYFKDMDAAKAQAIILVALENYFSENP